MKAAYLIQTTGTELPKGGAEGNFALPGFRADGFTTVGLCFGFRTGGGILFNPAFTYTLQLWKKFPAPGSFSRDLRKLSRALWRKFQALRNFSRNLRKNSRVPLPSSLPLGKLSRVPGNLSRALRNLSRNHIYSRLPRFYLFLLTKTN